MPKTSVEWHSSCALTIMSTCMSAGEPVVKRAVGAAACVWVVGATGRLRRSAGPQQQQPSWCGAYTDLLSMTTAHTMALHTMVLQHT